MKDEVKAFLATVALFASAGLCLAFVFYLATHPSAMPYFVGLAVVVVFWWCYHMTLSSIRQSRQWRENRDKFPWSKSR